MGGVLSDAGRGVSDKAAALARWRRSQRHADARADMSAWAAAWTWMQTPPEQQRALCTALHFHEGGCPTKSPSHRCHRGPCPAAHHSREGER